MKHSLYCLIFFIIVMSFCSCSSNNIDAVIFSNLNLNLGEDFAVLINNNNDLQAFCDETLTEQCDEAFRAKMMTFDDTFFQEKMIILISHWEITSSSKLSVENIEFSENNINVIVRRDAPQIVDNSLKDYFIVVEVPQDADYSSATYEVRGKNI